MGVYSGYSASASDYQNAAQALKTYLENTGYFSAVTIDTSTNVYEVNCTYGGNTVASFSFEYKTGGYYGVFSVTLGAYTGTFNIYSSGTTIWLGKTGNGVSIAVIGASDGKISTQCVICKSKSETPMMCLHSNVTPYYIALTADCESTPDASTAVTPSTNAYYSNLCGICTHYTGGESSDETKNVYRIVERQTNVPETNICIINIGGTKYLTDSFFAIVDSNS